MGCGVRVGAWGFGFGAWGLGLSCFWFLVFGFWLGVLGFGFESRVGVWGLRADRPWRDRQSPGYASAFSVSGLAFKNWG